MLKASSSLFGKAKNATLRPPPTTASYATAQSTLFGNIATGNSVPAKDQLPSGSVRFQKLVEKINSTLVIAPTMPKVGGIHTYAEIIAKITI